MVQKQGQPETNGALHTRYGSTPIVAGRRSGRTVIKHISSLFSCVYYCNMIGIKTKGMTIFIETAGDEGVMSYMFEPLCFRLALEIATTQTAICNAPWPRIKEKRFNKRLLR